MIMFLTSYFKSFTNLLFGITIWSSSLQFWLCKSWCSCGDIVMKSIFKRPLEVSIEHGDGQDCTDHFHHHLKPSFSQALKHMVWLYVHHQKVGYLPVRTCRMEQYGGGWHNSSGGGGCKSIHLLYLQPHSLWFESALQGGHCCLSISPFYTFVLLTAAQFDPDVKQSSVPKVVFSHWVERKSPTVMHVTTAKQEGMAYSPNQWCIGVYCY